MAAPQRFIPSRITDVETARINIEELSNRYNKLLDAFNALPAPVVLPANLVYKDVGGHVDPADLGTGTADATTFLRGDQTYDVPAGGGGGGRTLIDSEVLAVNTAVVSLTGIPATYEDLLVQIWGRSSKAGDNDEVRVQFNGDTGANYTYSHENRFSTTQGEGATFMQVGSVDANTAPASRADVMEMYISRYHGGAWYRRLQCNSWTRISGGGVIANAGGLWHSNADIVSVQLFLAAGSWMTNSEFRVYGF